MGLSAFIPLPPANLRREKSPCTKICEAICEACSVKSGKASMAVAVHQKLLIGVNFVGYLISNYHVVKDATKVRLLTSAGLIDAKVVQVDAANDLAC